VLELNLKKSHPSELVQGGSNTRKRGKTVKRVNQCLQTKSTITHILNVLEG